MTDMPEMGGMPSNDELVPFFTFEDIDHALENGEFCCYLQPKCNAETGTIVGAEALVLGLARGDLDWRCIVNPSNRPIA